MTSRERLLKALNNQKPDCLPCQVHSWMQYYLDTFLNGMDQWQAYDHFDMDHVIYNFIEQIFDDAALANWKVETKKIKTDDNGTTHYDETITTPHGQLHRRYAQNQYTTFDTEHLIKNKKDFEIFNKYWPDPVSIDPSRVHADKQRLGDRGIMRTYCIARYYGQGSPWQCLCYLMGTEPSIMAAFDDAAWVHHALDQLLEKSLHVIRLSKDVQTDLIETGGGAGSNTVISPGMFEKFCLPYDIRQNKALHDAGFKVAYHLCGGLMQMADMVVESRADALETMTPVSMGGDCSLADASRRWGDKLCFIGGFDQNAGFENGTTSDVKRLVKECFEATKDNGGYILSPSDHFFSGDPENIKAFVKQARQCTYE